ncbi:MAG: hypothetical protein ACRD4Y_08215, partial [Candidatus Acidiferrales bacterium]
FHPELTTGNTVHEYFLRMANSEIAMVEGKDPLLGLAGSGKGLWSGEHADDFVRRHRENCE